MSDDQIISAALGVADEASDEEDPCDKLRPVCRTAKEVIDALVVLEEFCYNVPDSTLALEGLSHACKLVLSAQLFAKKAKRHKLFVKVKVWNERTDDVCFCYSFDKSTFG